MLTQTSKDSLSLNDLSCTIAALVTLGIMLVIYMIFLQPFSHPIPLDFRTFYYAAQTYADNGNIYNHQELNTLAQTHNDSAYVFPYLYPPTLAFYISPLGSLSGKIAALLWGLLSIGSISLALFFVLKIAKSTPKISSIDSSKALIAVFALLLILPFYNNLKMGQVNAVVLMFMSASFCASYTYNKPLLAGILLAPAALIKITPIGLLVFFCLRKQYTAAMGLLIGLILLMLPTAISATGMDSWKQFLEFMPMASYGKTIPGLFPPDVLFNFSVAGLMSRIISSPQQITFFTILVLGIFSAALLSVHWKLIKIRNTDKSHLLLLPYLVLMVIGSPLTYLHHVVYLYPGVALATMTKEQPNRKNISLLMLWVLIIFASIDFPLYYGRLGMESDIITSLNLYAMMGLFVVSLQRASKATR